MPEYVFEWDHEKDLLNQEKHGVSFALATRAFEDPNRMIVKDRKHSTKAETRYFCIGKVKRGVLTVRFTYRQGKIRLYGPGFWREGKYHYESQSR
jgi:uncharacterized protein